VVAGNFEHADSCESWGQDQRLLILSGPNSGIAAHRRFVWQRPEMVKDSIALHRSDNCLQSVLMKTGVGGPEWFYSADSRSRFHPFPTAASTRRTNSLAGQSRAEAMLRIVRNEGFMRPRSSIPM